MQKLTINKSWFYSAGDKYGWVPEFDKRGVGINVRLLSNGGEMEVVVDKISYILDTGAALMFIKRYGSTEIQKGVTIGIVSKSLCWEITK